MSWHLAHVRVDRRGGYRNSDTLISGISHTHTRIDSEKPPQFFGEVSPPELERIIQKGKDTFVEVGTALAEIRDAKLFKPAQTFEEYCETRWGFSKPYATQLIGAAKVVENLKSVAIATTPKTESQARPLTKLPAAQQPAAWEKAQEIAAEEGKPVAARRARGSTMLNMFYILPQIQAAGSHAGARIDGDGVSTVVDTPASLASSSRVSMG